MFELVGQAIDKDRISAGEVKVAVEIVGPF